MDYRGTRKQQETVRTISRLLKAPPIRPVLVKAGKELHLVPPLLQRNSGVHHESLSAPCSWLSASSLSCHTHD